MVAEVLIHRLTYVSTAARSMDETDIDTLVTQARKNNERLEITGLLLFNGLNFLQTLEGPRDALEHVFAAIAGDPRHHGVVRVQADDATERAFADWAMAYSPVGRAGSDAKGFASNGFAWTQPSELPPHLNSLYLAFNSLGRSVTAPA